MHHDVSHPAAGSEQHSITEDERGQRGCDGRQGYPRRRKCASESHQRRCADPTEQSGRKIGANREEHRRYAEHGSKLRAVRLQELLQRCHKNAECIDRAERKAHDGGGAERRPWPRANANLWVLGHTASVMMPWSLSITKHFTIRLCRCETTIEARAGKNHPERAWTRDTATLSRFTLDGTSMSRGSPSGKVGVWAHA